MRADGKTVGQSKDEDAKFLRSIGVDAKDGQTTQDEARAEFNDKLRRAVLDALDEISPSGKGWVDGDLTLLFKALDQHSDNLFNRLTEEGYREFNTNNTNTKHK